MDYKSYLEPGKDRNRLVVAIHGFAGASSRLKAVREVVREVLPDSDILVPKLPLHGWNGLFGNVEDIVADLMKTIDELVAERRTAAGGGYASITLVGHSLGAVIARKIMVLAFGEQRGEGDYVLAPFEPRFKEYIKPRDWAGKIDRMVLLAGMNRGWSVAATADWITAVKWSVLELVGETVFFRRPLIFSIRKGAPFLANTRLQWLTLANEKYGPKPTAVTVQLLGTVDDEVSPDDSVDYAVDRAGVKAELYFYIEVRNSGHSSVTEMAEEGAPEEASQRKHRREQFLFALTAPVDALREHAVTREQMSDNLPPASDHDVTDVVFVIHGIRDKGFWTQKIARTIKKLAPAGRRFASFSGSYGYFAILPFLVGTVRQRKVEWLMDRYVEARACFPNANFHYVGHSNGTYLAAQALHDYRAARFAHIVFAGSVVRCDYDWERLIKPGVERVPRVSKVLNYVATSDWVVAMFPKAMQPIKFLNLGSAGHDGFDQAKAEGPVHNVRFIQGNHGAGHQEEHWEDIARFVISGAPPPETYPPLIDAQSTRWRLMGRNSFWIFPLALLLVLFGGWTLARSVFEASSATAAGLLSIATFVYFSVVYLFVTRF